MKSARKPRARFPRDLRALLRDAEAELERIVRRQIRKLEARIAELESIIERRNAGRRR
jgi:hypothetical protein